MTFDFWARDTPGARVIEWGTRRKGQPFPQVPSHCAMVWPDRVIEAIAGQGVISRLPASYDTSDPMLVARLIVPLKDEQAARAWAESIVGLPYDWLADVEDALGVLLPRFSVRQKTRFSYNCSRACLGAAASGGLVLPDTRTPYSPNALLYALEN